MGREHLIRYKQTIEKHRTKFSRELRDMFKDFGIEEIAMNIKST